MIKNNIIVENYIINKITVTKDKKTIPHSKNVQYFNMFIGKCKVAWFIKIKCDDGMSDYIMIYNLLPIDNKKIFKKLESTSKMF